MPTSKVERPVWDTRTVYGGTANTRRAKCPECSHVNHPPLRRYVVSMRGLSGDPGRQRASSRLGPRLHVGELPPGGFSRPLGDQVPFRRRQVVGASLSALAAAALLGLVHVLFLNLAG